MIEIKNNAEFGEIYIYGDVVSDTSEMWSYEDVCPSVIVDQIKELNNKPLNIRISSYGGSVFGGIAIYNVLKSYKGLKTVYIDSCACSISSVIAMCADKIVMYKNSYMMIHSAWVGGIQGNATELRKQADLLEEMDSTILNIYKTKLRDDFSVEDLQSLIKAETWLKSDECINIFNDIEIVEEKAVAFAKATESDFFNNYKNVPSELLEEEEKEDEEVVEVEEEVVEEEKEDEEVEVEEEVVEEEQVEEEDEQVEEENCSECGKNPCECEEIKRQQEEERQQEIAQAKKELDFINARAFLDNLLK